MKRRIQTIEEFITENSQLNEGGTLRIEKEKDGKFYWTYTFKSGKFEKYPDGFKTNADATRHFMQYSRLLKEGKNDFMVASPNRAEFWLKGIKDPDIREDVGSRMFEEVMLPAEKIAAENNLDITKMIISVK